MDINISEDFQSSPKGISISKPHEIDKELQEILNRQKAAIKVIGAGGAGNNTINRITPFFIIKKNF